MKKIFYGLIFTFLFLISGQYVKAAEYVNSCTYKGELNGVEIRTNLTIVKVNDAYDAYVNYITQYNELDFGKVQRVSKWKNNMSECPVYLELEYNEDNEDFLYATNNGNTRENGTKVGALLKKEDDKAYDYGYARCYYNNENENKSYFFEAKSDGNRINLMGSLTTIDGANISSSLPFGTISKNNFIYQDENGNTILKCPDSIVENEDNPTFDKYEEGSLKLSDISFENKKKVYDEKIVNSDKFICNPNNNSSIKMFISKPDKKYRIVDEFDGHVTIPVDKEIYGYYNEFKPAKVRVIMTYDKDSQIETTENGYMNIKEYYVCESEINTNNQCMFYKKNANGDYTLEKGYVDIQKIDYDGKGLIYFKDLNVSIDTNLEYRHIYSEGENRFYCPDFEAYKIVSEGTDEPTSYRIKYTGSNYFDKDGLNGNDIENINKEYSGTKFLELMGALKNPLRFLNSKYQEFDIVIDNKITTMKDIHHNELMCSTNVCKEEPKIYTEKGVREIRTYCNDIYKKYVKNSSNESINKRFEECKGFEHFYGDLVKNNVIDSQSSGCDIMPKALQEKLQWFLKMIRIAGPILAIALGTVDFVKVVANGDAEKEMKTAGKKFMNRIIAAVLLFVIPFILAFLMDLFLKNKPGYNTDNPFCIEIDWDKE